MCFMQIETVLQTKNRSEPAKNLFSVALLKMVFKMAVRLLYMSDSMFQPFNYVVVKTGNV